MGHDALEDEHAEVVGAAPAADLPLALAHARDLDGQGGVGGLAPVPRHPLAELRVEPQQRDPRPVAHDRARVVALALPVYGCCGSSTNISNVRVGSNTIWLW